MGWKKKAVLIGVTMMLILSLSVVGCKPKEAEVSPLKVSVPIQKGELDLSRDQHIELQEKLIECSAATLQAITLTNSALFIDPGKTSYGEFCERVDIAIQACELAAQKAEELENITGRLLVSGQGMEKSTLYRRGVVPRLLQLSLVSPNEPVVLIEASPQNDAEKRKLLRELLQIGCNDTKMMKTVYKMAKQLGFSQKYIVAQLQQLDAESKSTAEAYEDKEKIYNTLLKTAMVIRDGAKITVFVGGTILLPGVLAGTLTLGKAGLTVIEGAGLACGVAEDAAYIAYGTEDFPAAFKYIKMLGNIVSVRNLGPKAIKQLVNLAGNMLNMLFITEKTVEYLPKTLEKYNVWVKLPKEGGEEAKVSLPDKEELEESIPQPAEPEKVGLIPGDYIDAEGESITVEEVSQVIVEQVVALGEVLLPSEEIEEEVLAEEEAAAKEAVVVQDAIEETIGDLQLDTTQWFNYELPSIGSRVERNALPLWYSGEYNSHQLSVVGGTPPYVWRYKTAGGVMTPTLQTSGITFGIGGSVEGTADELPGSTLHRQLYVTAIVTDSCRPPQSIDITLRLDIADNRAVIARQVTEQFLQEVTKMVQSAIASAGGMPPGTSLSFSYAIIGEPKKVDGPQWIVPVNQELTVTVSVEGFSTSTGGYVKYEVVVDAKKKSVLDMKLIEYKIN